MKEATNIIKKYKFDDYELKKNFDKAYEDDDFRKIVNDIDMLNERRYEEKGSGAYSTSYKNHIDGA